MHYAFAIDGITHNNTFDVVCSQHEEFYIRDFGNF